MSVPEVSCHLEVIARVLFEIVKVDVLQGDLVAVTKVDNNVLPVLAGMIEHVVRLLDAVQALEYLQHVLADLEVRNDVLARRLAEDENIRVSMHVSIARQQVVSGSTDQRIPAAAADDCVVATQPPGDIVTALGKDPIPQARSLKYIIAGAAKDRRHMPIPPSNRRDKSMTKIKSFIQA